LRSKGGEVLLETTLTKGQVNEYIYFPVLSAAKETGSGPALSEVEG
jgi:hypothetical protein